MANKTVLVTGAAKRLGAGLARYLHGQGMDIILHYHHSQDEAQVLADELSELRDGSILTVMGDLRDPDAPRQIISAAAQFKGHLDVLINNASVFYPTPTENATLSQWDESIAVNMRAPYFLTKEAASYLRIAKGCIINIADIHVDRPLYNYSIYCASKAGLVMLTRALARELGPAIRVNAIAPGAILWPESMPISKQNDILDRTVLKQAGSTDDIAKAIRYLILDGDYITGQVLTVDGGRTLYS